MRCVCDIILTYTRSTTFNVCQKNIRNVCQNRERCDRRKIYAHNNHSTKFTEMFFFISNVISMRAVAVLVRVERKWSLFNCMATAIAITFTIFGQPSFLNIIMFSTKNGRIRKAKILACSVQNAQPIESFESYRCALFTINHSIQLISTKQFVDVFDFSVL